MDFTNENNLIENQECSIFYSGDLYRKNSDRVFIVYGFGNNWEHTTEKEMLKQENGFLAKIRMLQYNNIHFCFRNSNYEWDNNNSANYTLPILEADKNSSYESTTINTTENDKNELLNNILEESNTELDYVQEFDIDALIEEILSPLLEERLYSFEENDTTETKVNESVTTLLNNELYAEPSKDTVSENINPIINETSEFSMSELIEDLRKDIIETASALVADTDITTNYKDEQVSNVSPSDVFEDSELYKISNTINTTINNDIKSQTIEEAFAEDENSDLSSIIVDELLEDITQIFDNSELNSLDEIEEESEILGSSVDIKMIENTNIEEKNNDDDDDNNITPISFIDNNSYYIDVEDLESDIDIDEEINQDESEDTDFNNDNNEIGFDPTAENDYSDSAAACTALTVRNEDRFVICSRKLTTFYMIRKKIKLALYKVFYAIPRMIRRELNSNKTQD